MCHLSSQASSDPDNYAEKCELLCRRYDANTPYELATVIYGKMKAHELLKKEEDMYNYVKDNDGLKKYLGV